MALMDTLKARFEAYLLKVGVRKASVAATGALALLLANPKVAPYLAMLGIHIDMTTAQEGIATLLTWAGVFALDFINHHATHEVTPPADTTTNPPPPTTPA